MKGVVMQTVRVRGADGSERELALVKRESRVVYVCPINRFAEVERGDEDAVVGFPVEDVVWNGDEANVEQGPC
jgi:hypothetical protein